jgi:molybdopterin/thiamine biosynthesis adenylyltransferase
MPTLRTSPDVQSRARRAGYDPDVLGRSCVIVVGTGALGQNLAQDLALSGVRTLRLVDGDVFEEHNRSRSPLHPRRGHYAPGERLPKAQLVAEELARIHVDDEARVIFADTWIEELGLGAFAGVDVIAACVDSLVARAYLAKVAMLLDIAMVEGGFSGANLGMTAYPAGGDPTTKPCWSCAGAAVPGAFSCEQYARYADANHIVPAIQNGAAALGAMCAEAIIGILHDRESEPRRIALDLRSGESSVFRPQPDPVCAARHRRLPDPVETTLTPHDSAAAALEELGEHEATLFPSDVYIERAHCPSTGCGATCDVGAPMHRWRRDPHCVECGGPWPRAAVHTPSPDVIDAGLAADDPRSGLSLGELGMRLGDVVELDGRSAPAFRLAGEPDDLFTEAAVAAAIG